MVNGVIYTLIENLGGVHMFMVCVKISTVQFF